MSRAEVFEQELLGHVCEFCGFEIDEEGKDCPALDEGVCRP